MNTTFILVLVLGLRHGIATDHVTVLNGFIQSTRARIRTALRYAVRLWGGHSLGMAIVGVAIIQIAPSRYSSFSQWIDRVGAIWILGISIIMILDSWGFEVDILASIKSYLHSPSSSWIIGAVLGLSLGTSDILFFGTLTAHSLSISQNLSLFLVFFIAMLTTLSVVAVGFSILHGDLAKNPQIVLQISQWIARLAALVSFGMGIVLLLESI